jgi:predicted TIM-barrel fold metal-dependent hydrolase
MRLLVLLCLSALLAAAACSSTPEKKERRARRYEGPIIDLHAHLDDDDKLLKNAVGDRVFKVGAMVTALGKIEDTRALNDRVLALAARSPKIVPICSVHPADGKAALDEIDRVFQAGARMLFFSPTAQGFALEDPRFNDVVAKAASLTMIVYFESTVPDPDLVPKVVQLAGKNPNARIVIAHMGLADFHQMLHFDVMRKEPWYNNNVFFDVSVTAQLFEGGPYAEQLAWVIRRLGDRVLFGSHYPADSSLNAADAVAKLGLSEAEAGGVLYTNAARLLGL